MKTLIAITAFMFLFVVSHAQKGLDKNDWISDFSMDYDVHPDCSGLIGDEWINVTGRVHVILNSNDKGMTKVHYNLIATGIGLTTGNEYMVRQSWNDIYHGGLPTIITFRQVLHFIQKGNAPDVTQDCFFKVVVNANGETKVFINKLREARCK